MIIETSDREYWFAYRNFHNNSHLLKAQLKEDDISSFVSMELFQQKQSNSFGLKKVPVIYFLIRSAELYTYNDIRYKLLSYISVYSILPKILQLLFQPKR